MELELGRLDKVSGASVTQSKGQRTQQKIIDVAIDLLSREGVASFTFEAIAKKLKLSKPHVRYYFSSKELLIQKCIEQIILVGQELTKQEIEKHHSWEPRLMGTIRGAFQWIEQNPHYANLLFIFFHYCCVDKNLATAHSKIRQVGRLRMMEILVHCPKRKVSVKLAEEIAFEMQMISTGVLMEVTTTGNIRHIKDYEEKCVAEVRRILKAHGLV